MNGAAGLLCASESVTERCLAILHDRIGTQRFNAWFKHGTHLQIEEAHVRVSVPNPFVANWIETHYQGEIASAVEELTGGAKPVVMTIDPSLMGELRKSHLDTQAEMVSRATTGRVRPRHNQSRVSLKYKLSDFIVGPTNKLAYSAATAVCGARKPPFNPLFIHGSCGVGKTHLLQGICNAATKVVRGSAPIAWRYVTAEQFTNEFIRGLRQKKLGEFRAAYRRLDLLVIDDVHFLSAKKATQDEFLHTFDDIQSADRQIVLASDAHPRLVGELSERLASRFVAGMVVKIDPPDLPTRLAVLRRKAKGMKLHVGRDVLEYIAMQIRGSVRELEGTLIKLAALSMLENSPVTLSLATEVLADQLARTDSALTLGDIEAAVAAYFGVTAADLHSSRRTRTVSLARMVAMFLARRHTPMSYPEIGKSMAKNHSSVVLAVQKMEKTIAAGESLTWMTPMGRKSTPAGALVELLTEQIC